MEPQSDFRITARRHAQPLISTRKAANLYGCRMSTESENIPIERAARDSCSFSVALMSAAGEMDIFRAIHHLERERVHCRPPQ